ncbi:MAG: PIN domain-containing protein [Terriglobales bacterium]
MPATDFLDSNILVYAYDASNPRKQSVAQALVERAVAGEAMASTQVLAEFAATLLHRLTPPADPEAVTAILDALGPVKLIAPDAGMVRRAVEAHSAYGVHFYDGMILAAAERGGCARLLSEDLNPGQEYFGVKVSNPFAGLA